MASAEISARGARGVRVPCCVEELAIGVVGTAKAGGRAGGVLLATVLMLAALAVLPGVVCEGRSGVGNVRWCMTTFPACHTVLNG